MSNNSNKSNGTGITFGIGDILFIIFLVLKLTGLINWSWWWITAPLWIGFGLFLIISLVYIIIFKIKN